MIRHLIAALLLGVSSAASATGVAGVTLMLDDAGSPGEEVEAFHPGDHHQRFRIELDETELGSHEFVVEFWAVDTAAAANTKVTEFKGGALVANTIDADVSLPRDWPIGSYRLDVLMDGEPIGSFDYEVVAP
jgi:hypothetical protein